MMPPQSSGSTISLLQSVAMDAVTESELNQCKNTEDPLDLYLETYIRSHILFMARDYTIKS